MEGASTALTRQTPEADRKTLPLVLLPADLALALGLPSERAALELIQKHRLPYVPLGKRKLVLRDSLLDYLKDREVVPESEEEIEARAELVIAQVLPRARRKSDSRG